MNVASPTLIVSYFTAIKPPVDPLRCESAWPRERGGGGASDGDRNSVSLCEENRFQKGGGGCFVYVARCQNAVIYCECKAAFLSETSQETKTF